MTVFFKRLGRALGHYQAGNISVAPPPPPPSGTFLWELEDGSGFWELEDGSGYWELEEGP
jgi:hypothetical protein